MNLIVGHVSAFSRTSPRAAPVWQPRRAAPWRRNYRRDERSAALWGVAAVVIAALCLAVECVVGR